MSRKLFENALRALNSGHVVEALGELDSLVDLELDPEERSTVLLGQASSLMQLGRIEEARMKWSQAVACCGNQYTDYIDLLLCGLENRGKEAIPKFTEFLSRREELTQAGDGDLWSDAAQRLGYILFESGQYGDAIKPLVDAAETAETESRRSAIRLYLGMCYTQVGNFEAAEKTLVEILPTDPKDSLWPNVQYQLGRLYFRWEANAQAKTALEQFLAMDGFDPDLSRSASQLLGEVKRRLLTEERRIV
jgi:tetratricopeptide (TPR) repeat protein